MNDSIAVEDLCLLGRDIVTGWMDGSHSSEHFIAFVSKGLEAKTLQSFETVETTHIIGQCHVAEDIKSR